MKSFTYQIKDELGIHARPAGELTKAAKQYESQITIAKGEKSATSTQIIKIMGLGVKCGDEITVTAEGADEAIAAEGMLLFLEKNL